MKLKNREAKLHQLARAFAMGGQKDVYRLAQAEVRSLESDGKPAGSELLTLRVGAKSIVWMDRPDGHRVDVSVGVDTPQHLRGKLYTTGDYVALAQVFEVAGKPVLEIDELYAKVD